MSTPARRVWIDLTNSPHVLFFRPVIRRLDEAGVEHPRRDMDAKRLHPEDLFNVGPASFSEIHPDLHEPGLSWGAAKAHVHIQRRRAEAAIASSAAESP